MNTLDKLFGSSEIVRILRLFISNPETIYPLEDIVRRSRVKRDTVRTEIKMLENIEFVGKRSFVKEPPQDRKSRKTSGRKKRVMGYQLNPDFELLTPLRNLLLNTEPFKDKEIRSNMVAMIGEYQTNALDKCSDILVLINKNKKKMLFEWLQFLHQKNAPLTTPSSIIALVNRVKDSNYNETKEKIDWAIANNRTYI